MQTANQGKESGRTKTILRLLNILILSSLFLLPSLLFISALNVEEIATTMKLDNQTQTIQGGKIMIASAISARNVGPFSVDATIKATVTGGGGTKIDIPIPQISLPAGTTLNKQPIEVSLDLNSLPKEEIRRLALEAENLTISASAVLALRPITSITLGLETQTTWLPPIHNPTLGTSTVKAANATKITVETPITFENQSPYLPVNGLGTIRVYDASNQSVGAGRVSVSAPQMRKWSGTSIVQLSTPKNVKDLILKDSTLTYRVETDFTMNELNLTTTALDKTINVDWGALIKNPQITITTSTYNSTHTLFDVKLSASNNNQYIATVGTATPELTVNGQALWVGTPQKITIQQKQSSTLELQGTIPNTQLASPLNPKLILKIETAIGETELEVGLIG